MAEVINLREQKLREFFDQDVVDLKLCPDEEVQKVFSRKHLVDFSSIKNDVSRQQFKDILVSMICYERPYSISSNRRWDIFRLPGFLSGLKGITDIPPQKLKEEWSAYVDGKKYDKNAKTVITACQEALFEYYDKREGFDRDLWVYGKTYTLPEERRNKSNSTQSFHFRNIENPHNRDLVKLYIKHLIGDTEQAFSTIYGSFCMLASYCTFLGDKDVLKATSKDIHQFLTTVKKMSVDSSNRALFSALNFYNYMMVKEKTTFNPAKDVPSQKLNQREIANTVSEYVILQVFNHLHKAPFIYQLIYLISLSTGMRISDICQLRTDCLREDGDGGYYIEPYTCQKMQKPIMCLIPKSLYDLIKEQIKIINALDYDEIYLFPSDKTKNHPYQTQTYLDNFKGLCREWGIKNEDGSLYEYRTHSYRHTIASDLYQNYNVPAQIISLGVLYHKELQMSMHYIERPDDFKKLQEDKYISKWGESELTDFMKETIRDHVLPNGLCGMTDRLGVCPALDACLSCEHFLTSKKFLPVHKEQLASIKAKLPLFESNGWKDNVATAQRQIRELENIINLLEGREELDADEPISPKATIT